MAIYSFTEYLLNSHNMPGTLLGAGNTAVKKIISNPHEISVLVIITLSGWDHLEREYGE